MRIVVIDGATADQGDASVWNPLQNLGPLVRHARTAPSEVVARCEGASVVLTNKTVFDAATLAKLPALRYLGVTATGTNVVDVKAALAQGVVVTNVPAYSTASVAQLVVAMVLHFTQGVAVHDARVKAGDWAQGPDFCFLAQQLTELSGKTAVVVGSGEIGKAVTRIFDALGMHVVAAAVPGSPAKASRMPLDQALGLADVVTLHCPLTETTRGMVDAAFLARMKKDAVLVNTARGPLIDETALVAALMQGRLRGVGLDVLAKEPPAQGHSLLDPRAPYASRVVVTPHIAWATDEARARLISETIENVLAWARGEARHRVSP